MAGQVENRLQSFAEHYGTVFLPTKPYRPEHKGKVESGVKYAKNNALKGRKFASLAEQNEFLLDWEAKVADTRIHGTTKKQVGKQFREVEQATLLSLPSGAFPLFQGIAPSRQSRRASGSGQGVLLPPPEYVGRRLWVRWDSHLVRIFNDRWEKITVHAKVEPGQFQTSSQHIPTEKFSAVERSGEYLFEIIMRRHQVRSTIMTSNRPLEDWGKLIGDVPAATAILDRFLQDAILIQITGKSYRMRGATGAKPAKNNPPQSAGKE